MAIVRRQNQWDPFREFENLSQRFNQLFGLAAPGIDEAEYVSPTAWMPACDISETDKAYLIRAELPEIRKEDVRVNLENNVLTLEGERKEEKEIKEEKYHRREMTYGKFLRRFTLPDDINADKVDASYKDGVLTVTVPREKSRAIKAKKIDVH